MRTHRPFYPRLDQGGLTLLELLLVVTILSAVAWMSLEVVNNAGDQTRFEDTRNRLQAIRRAIVGDTSRTLNGQPVISGYVADMGQLPPHLQALMVKDYCVGYPEITNAGDCVTAGGTWQVQSAHTYDDTYNLWSGWNGPYLAATEMTGYNRFQDGWGRRDDTTNNFGWNYSFEVDLTGNPTGNLTIQSYGADGAVGGTDYEGEYPPATAIPNIDDGEYRVLVTDDGATPPPVEDGNGGIYVDFGTVPPCWGCFDAAGTAFLAVGRKACVDASRTWRPASAVNEAACASPLFWLATASLPPLPENICVAVAAISAGTVPPPSGSTALAYTWDGSHQLLMFKFADGTFFNTGRLTFGVFEYDDTTLPPTCNTAKPFTGMTAWKPFDVVPRTNLPPLQWDIK